MKYIVYCSGKCGTNTLYNSFSRLGPTEWFHHLHGHKKEISRVNRIVNNIQNSEIKTIVIDSFRDPIDRKISAYFQNILIFYNCSKEVFLKMYMEKGIQFILDDFDKRLLEIANLISFHDWKQIVDYDVYKVKFDHEKKVQIYNKNGNTFINLRFDDISLWEEIIKNINIKELQNFKLVNGNQSKNKWYYNIYIEFKSKFKLTQYQFDEIYKLHKNAIEHFYTDAEIHNFKQKCNRTFLYRC